MTSVVRTFLFLPRNIKPFLGETNMAKCFLCGSRVGLFGKVGRTINKTWLREIPKCGNLFSEGGCSKYLSDESILCIECELQILYLHGCEYDTLRHKMSTNAISTEDIEKAANCVKIKYDKKTHYFPDMSADEKLNMDYSDFDKYIKSANISRAEELELLVLKEAIETSQKILKLRTEWINKKSDIEARLYNAVNEAEFGILESIKQIKKLGNSLESDSYIFGVNNSLFAFTNFNTVTYPSYIKWITNQSEQILKNIAKIF